MALESAVVGVSAFCSADYAAAKPCEKEARRGGEDIARDTISKRQSYFLPWGFERTTKESLTARRSLRGEKETGKEKTRASREERNPS